jgi:capsular exopolysaccharide synthesis family protein
VQDLLEKHRIVAHNKHDPNTGAYDSLRTQVMQKMRASGWKTLGIASPTSGSGKSVTAINLAISISQLVDQTCLLLDLDLRQPSVLDYLGIDHEPTLNQFFNGDCDFAATLSRPLLPDLVVSGARKAVQGSGEIMASTAMAGLLDEIRERYIDRLVVIDLPPLIGADDAIALLPRLDCVLLVVGNGQNSREEVERSVRHLSNTRLIGTVLNKSKHHDGNYYYAYGA